MVTLQDHGYINQQAVEYIATQGIEIGTSDLLGRINLTGLSGTRSILQQAIHYGIHYGTKFSFISHYNFSLLLKLEGYYEKGHIGWAVVPHGQARLILAFALWMACKDVKNCLTMAPKLKRTT